MSTNLSRHYAKERSIILIYKVVAYVNIVSRVIQLLVPYMFLSKGSYKTQHSLRVLSVFEIVLDMLILVYTLIASTRLLVVTYHKFKSRFKQYVLFIVSMTVSASLSYGGYIWYSARRAQDLVSGDWYNAWKLWVLFVF